MNNTEDQNQEGHSFVSSVSVIGLVGGILWSLIGYIAFYFNFTKFGPSLVLLPWAFGKWKHGPLGHWIGIVMLGVLSIGIAYIYRILFARFNHIWLGILFGIGLWFLVFGLLNPLFQGMPSIAALDINTMITTLSIFSIYGLFIGYSISYEFQELTVQREKPIQE